MQVEVAPLAGFVIGTLVGLSGMGAGVALLPVLIYFFGLSPLVAVGTAAGYSALTKISAAYLHWRQRTVDGKLVLWLATGSLPGALLGVALLARLEARYGGAVNELLTTLIAMLLVVVPVLVVVQTVVQRRWDAPPLRRRLRSWIGPQHGGVATGLVGGLLVGMTSIGSGSVIMMIMLLFFSRRSAVLVGTDIVHALLLTGVTGGAHLALGNVDLPLVGWLVLGAVPGAYLGSRLAPRVPDLWLRGLLAVILVGTGVAML